MWRYFSLVSEYIHVLWTWQEIHLKLLSTLLQLGLAQPFFIIFYLFFNSFSLLFNKIKLSLNMFYIIWCLRHAAVCPTVLKHFTSLCTDAPPFSSSFIVSVLQFQEQLGQGCSPEESDTFQTQGQCDKVFHLDSDSSRMFDVFSALFLKDQRFLTRCCSALNIYQNLCHSWRYHIWHYCPVWL